MDIEVKVEEASSTILDDPEIGNAPLPEYVEFLDLLIHHMTALLAAAKDDLRRQARIR